MGSFIDTASSEAASKFRVEGFAASAVNLFHVRKEMSVESQEARKQLHSNRKYDG